MYFLVNTNVIGGPKASFDLKLNDLDVIFSLPLGTFSLGSQLLTHIETIASPFVDITSEREDDRTKVVFTIFNQEDSCNKKSLSLDVNPEPIER